MDVKELRRRGTLAFFIVALLSTVLIGQPDGRPVPPAEKSYDAELLLVIGSNDGARGYLPSNLTPVLKQIRSNFDFSSYRVASTFVGRVANTGSFEYKSVGSIFGRDSDTYPRSFLEWSLSNLRSSSSPGGQPSLQADSFRFGARIPVPTGGTSTEPTYSYESIGLNLAKAGVSENVPTLIGTLNLPGAGGVIFLVMRVRSAHM